MGEGFSTEGNEANEETTNELESTPISDSDFTGANGEGTEPEFSTTDAHGLTQMGGGFSTEGNEANEETTNELESTPISDPDVTGSNGEEAEAEFSTTDAHGLTQMGGGFSKEGNEANGETTNELESTPISDSGFIGSNGEGTEAEFSTTDGHGLTPMGGGFSTEGNEANGETTNELEATPIGSAGETGGSEAQPDELPTLNFKLSTLKEDSESTGGNPDGIGTGCGNREGRGAGSDGARAEFSTEGNEANGETTNELEATPISDSDFKGGNGEGTEPEFSTTDAHGLTQMGEGFSTEGNEANEETTNELESTPISDSDFTGSNGEGTEAEFSTTDAHGLT
jgi:hypothetical protein